eukprot:933830_1
MSRSTKTTKLRNPILYLIILALIHVSSASDIVVNGAQTSPPSSDKRGPAAPTRFVHAYVNLNTSDVNELTRLRGLSLTGAREILKHTTHHQFTGMNDAYMVLIKNYSKLGLHRNLLPHIEIVPPNKPGDNIEYFFWKTVSGEGYAVVAPRFEVFYLHKNSISQKGVAVLISTKATLQDLKVAIRSVLNLPSENTYQYFHYVESSSSLQNLDGALWYFYNLQEGSHIIVRDAQSEVNEQAPVLDWKINDRVLRTSLITMRTLMTKL